MPLTLEQYALSHLPSRGLPWPVAPTPDPPKAKPHLPKLPVKLVFWNVYGTLLAIPGGELQFEHPMAFVTDAALDKLIKEFKMWQSMSRKPGAPAAQMKDMMMKALTSLKMAGSGGEKFPEVQAERVWDDVVKKLFQKEYAIDAALYGPQPEFVKKVAYFYHASIQGTGCYPGAADALRMIGEAGTHQGLLADGQCFTVTQLVKGLSEQQPGFDLNAAVPLSLRVISADHKARKPSDTLFKAAVAAAAAKGVRPENVLHVGSNVARDLLPAKKHGMRTALFAGDKGSLAATPEQMKDPAAKPDALLTELPQLLEIVG